MGAVRPNATACDRDICPSAAPPARRRAGIVPRPDPRGPAPRCAGWAGWRLPCPARSLAVHACPVTAVSSRPGRGGAAAGRARRGPPTPSKRSPSSPRATTWSRISRPATASRSAFLPTRPWDRAEVRASSTRWRNARAVAADPAYGRLRRDWCSAAADRRDRAAVALAEPDRALEVSPYARVGWTEDHGTLRGARPPRRRARLAGARRRVLLAGDVYAGTHSPAAATAIPPTAGASPRRVVELNSYFDRGTAAPRGRLGRGRGGPHLAALGAGSLGHPRRSRTARRRST